MLHNQFEALGLKPYGAVPSKDKWIGIVEKQQHFFILV